MHSELDNLLEKIKKDVQEYFKHEKAGIFSDQNPTLQVSIDDEFELWWHNIIKVLINLPYPENYHYRLVTELKKHGFGDDMIDQFMRYFPAVKRAVWWYSRSGIFYDILNRAFRQRNVRVLLLFGSFLQDLYRELKREHQHIQQQSRNERPIVTVYRGQVLSEKDLAKLAVGCSIRSNALFSTSTDRSIAKAFLATSENLQDVNRILFEIEADYRDLTAVFADITQLSFYPDEDETLFMVNTRFLLHSQQEQNDLHGLPSYWLVKLKLQSNYDILRDRQLQAGSTRKTLKNCLSALSDMSEMKSTLEDTVVFDILMDIYPEEARWIEAVKLYSLAELEAQCCDDPREKKHDYSSAFSYYEQALAIWNEYLGDDDELNCSFDIAENYLAMAELYECGTPHSFNLSDNYLKEAVSSYELALQKCSARDYVEMEIVSKLGKVCRNLARTDWEGYGLKAVTYKERWIELITRDTIPSRPEYLVGEYQDLGDRYAVIHRYEDALSYYKKALELYLSADVEEDSLPCMTDLYRKIVIVCTQHTHDFNSALHYELLRHKCCLKQLAKNETAPSVLQLSSLGESHFSVADCYLNTREYIPAYKHLLEGLAYIRQKKDLVLEEGRLVIREGCLVYTSDGRPLREPCKPDDMEIGDCNCKIKEKEEKLKYVETLLENE